MPAFLLCLLLNKKKLVKESAMVWGLNIRILQVTLTTKCFYGNITVTKFMCITIFCVC